MPNLKLPGYVCSGSKFGLATVVVSGHFFKIKRSWRSEERCTAVLFGAVFVMAVFVLDCHKDLDVYETFIKNVTKLGQPHAPARRQRCSRLRTVAQMSVAAPSCSVVDRPTSIQSS